MYPSTSHGIEHKCSVLDPFSPSYLHDLAVDHIGRLELWDRYAFDRRQ